MAESRDDKPGSPPSWPLQKPADAAATPQPDRPPADRGAGRIVHDERGNAVWNWVKDTGRFCIDSTSALLKKLDISDLKIEGNDDTLGAGQGNGKAASPGVSKGARDSGGGYDPYNQKTLAKKSTVPARPTLNKPYVRPLNKMPGKK